ncbi:MAG: hypothetical protein JWP38_3618 [Herbaspirillum sp.]|jgi:hypothetical protein|nr:hypothetical protein [Herbaspirillum sp.]
MIEWEQALIACFDHYLALEDRCRTHCDNGMIVRQFYGKKMILFTERAT